MSTVFKLPLSCWNKSSVSHGTWTYFVGCQDFVKIGSAREPLKRIMHMQVGNPFALELIAVTAEPERTMQNSLARHHERGEWFRNRKEIEAYLAEWWLDKYGDETPCSIEQVAAFLRVPKQVAIDFVSKANVFQGEITEGQFLFLLDLCAEHRPTGLVLFEDADK